LDLLQSAETVKLRHLVAVLAHYQILAIQQLQCQSGKKV
jgi:hypothetical protein